MQQYLYFLPLPHGHEIIWIYLCSFSLFRSILRTLVLVGSGYLCHLLTFYLLLDASHGYRRRIGILLDAGGHVIEHIKSCHLVFYKRISLAVCLKSDTLTQLIHIIDVIHPLAVDDL